jgi:hypothetical protein
MKSAHKDSESSASGISIKKNNEIPVSVMEMPSPLGFFPDGGPQDMGNYSWEGVMGWL